MIMATPLGQTVTVQEVSVELKARGYYPLDLTPLPAVSPVVYDVIPGPVSPPLMTIPEGAEWIYDRPPPGYESLVTPVSPPVVYFQQTDLPVSPSIYEEFITKAAPPVVRHVAMEVTYEPPVSPPLDIIFPEPPLYLPRLEPEIPVSPPPGFIVQEFPDLLPDFQQPISPPADYLLPEWEIIPPDILPVSPLPEIVPVEEKKGPWLIIAVLGAAALLAGGEKKAVERPAA